MVTEVSLQSLNASFGIVCPPLMNNVVSFAFGTYEIAFVGIVAFSIGQSLNANCSMFVTLLPMVMEVSPVQPENALHPILVTLLPMVTEVSPLQYWNAQLPILVTLSGMVIEISPVQPENAYSPILVTPLPMVMEVSPVQPENAPLLNPVRTPHTITIT